MNRNHAFVLAAAIMMGLALAQTLVIQLAFGHENRPITVPLTIFIGGVLGWFIPNLGKKLAKEEE